MICDQQVRTPQSQLISSETDDLRSIGIAERSANLQRLKRSVEILVPFSMALAGTGEAGLAVLNVCLSVCLSVCVFVRNKQVPGLVAFWRVRV